MVESRAVSSSLKFGLIARGEADIYPRTGDTSEWDTAAGHAVLAAAGGTVTTLDGQPFLYGKPGFLNPGFVAWGRTPFRQDADAPGCNGAARMCTANQNPHTAVIWPHFRNTLREFLSISASLRFRAFRYRRTDHQPAWVDPCSHNAP